MSSTSSALFYPFPSLTTAYTGPPDQPFNTRVFCITPALQQLLITQESHDCQHNRLASHSRHGFPIECNCVRHLHVPTRWPSATTVTVARYHGRTLLMHRTEVLVTQHLQNHETMERHCIHKTGAGRDAVGSFVHPADTKFNRGGDISQIDD
jgi:hypothetical protein